MKMKCQVCKTNEAENHPTYGIIPCKTCRDRQSKLTKPEKQIEFTTESIKEQREEFADDIIQPFRKGELSKEYVQKYGTKGIKVSKEEIKKAKNVWDDLFYYKK